MASIPAGWMVSFVLGEYYFLKDSIAFSDAIRLEENENSFLYFWSKMPSNKIITPLVAGKYYHIYNRGINRQKIFFQQRNYLFFLSLLDRYLKDYINVYAYCLLPNHFHLLIQLNEVVIIKTENENLKEIKDEFRIGEIVSEQFRRMFISYSQAINRQEKRVLDNYKQNCLVVINKMTD